MKEVSMSLLREIVDFVGVKFENDYLRKLLPAIRENFKVVASMDRLDLDKSIEPTSFLALLLRKGGEDDQCL